MNILSFLSKFKSQPQIQPATNLVPEIKVPNIRKYAKVILNDLNNTIPPQDWIVDPLNLYPPFHFSHNTVSYKLYFSPKDESKTPTIAIEECPEYGFTEDELLALETGCLKIIKWKQEEKNNKKKEKLKQEMDHLFPNLV